MKKIEVNNFGYLKDGKTYAGTTAHESQIVELPEAFKGFKFWHRYSDAQLNKLKEYLFAKVFVSEIEHV